MRMKLGAVLVGAVALGIVPARAGSSVVRREACRHVACGNARWPAIHRHSARLLSQLW